MESNPNWLDFDFDFDLMEMMIRYMLKTTCRMVFIGDEIGGRVCSKYNTFIQLY